MNTYLLIRDNHETGPHSLDELKAMTLRNLDLIWLEGKSQHWDYATEFEELRPLIIQTNNFPKKPTKSRLEAGSLQPSLYTNHTAAASSGREVLAEPAGFALRSTLATEAPVFTERLVSAEEFHFPQRRSNRTSLWILSLLLMLMFGAYIVKKLVDDRNEQAARQFEPISYTEERSNEALRFQHAISTEKVAAPSLLTPRMDVEEIKKKVSITQNKHKQIGNNNDLQLTISNKSYADVSQVDIQVKFLEANGTVVRKENHSVYTISKGAVTTLVIPAAEPNQKVTYKITGVQLKETAVPQRHV